MEILKEQGVQGIKELTKQMKRDRRDRPKTVLSVYNGIPDAGQAFSMFLQGLHKQKCGLTQSEMDPCIFFKINKKDENTNAVKGYLVAITWVDDMPLFWH
jgi:hypothetical protein